jgi:putative DNA primase/helicase
LYLVTNKQMKTTPDQPLAPTNAGARGTDVDELGRPDAIESPSLFVDGTPPQEAPKLDAALQVEGPSIGTALTVYTHQGASNAQGPAYRSFDNFVMDDGGLWNLVDGETIWVCSPFEILGRGRKPGGHDWSLALRWADDDGRLHELVLPDAGLQRNFARLCGQLASEGLRIAVGPPRELLQQYLNRVKLSERITIVSRTGWHEMEAGPVFALPTEIFDSVRTEPVIFDGALDSANIYTSRGSLEDWRKRVAAPLAGHMVPMLAMSAAFVGPLLALVNGEGGGLHFFGYSSIGKTTVCVQAPASVWGPPGLVRSWRSTANGLEGLAALATDTFLPLDELGVAEAKDVAASVYQLASNVGKARAKSNGALTATRSWRVSIVSTGELPMTAKLMESGRKTHAGQLVRMLDLPADAGCGFGVFDGPGPLGDPARLADVIKRAAGTVYGTAGPAFLRRLVGRGDADLLEMLVEHLDDFRRRIVPGGADGQVVRAANRLGLVAAAGELAIAWGILPWSSGEVDRAAAQGFQKWLELRGGHGAQEDHRAFAQVRQFLEEHDSRFQRPGTTESRPIKDLAGWAKGEGDAREWWVLPHVWQKEVCAGLDPTATARLLTQRGLLRPDERGGKFARAERTPLGSKRVYVISAAILSKQSPDGSMGLDGR